MLEAWYYFFSSRRESPLPASVITLGSVRGQTCALTYALTWQLAIPRFSRYCWW
jgi:hypothetical protein